MIPYPETLSVAGFLPTGYATDGSVSYQRELQRAIDAAAPGQTVAFPPITYRLDESGLVVHSHLTLSMSGALFELSGDCRSDGQAFCGSDVVDVRFLGGAILGHNEIWPEGVNVRGIHLTGRAQQIHIRDMLMSGLSSNGIGIMGDPAHPSQDIWVTDVTIEKGSNVYGDYMSERPGPESGSTRQDQGLIAFYHVEDFCVRGSQFEGSRSDATHFYRCRRGQFVHNKVYRAQMGGYFLETCEDVVASDNLIRDNGSRGVTIERGSKRCTLCNNVVSGSGREGLWAPNCTALVISGNIFDHNGRKPNGGPGQIWNANVTVDSAPHDPTHSPTQDYILTGNILYTTEDQIAAIRVDAAHTQDIVIRDNLLRGENREIMIEGQEDRR